MMAVVWGRTAMSKAASTKEIAEHALTVEGIGEVGIVGMNVILVAVGVILVVGILGSIGALLLKARNEVPEGS
jgi:hypothetical protein